MYLPHNYSEVERFRGANDVAVNVLNRLPARSPSKQQDSPALGTARRNNLPNMRVNIFSLRVDQRRNRSCGANAVVAEE